MNFDGKKPVVVLVGPTSVGKTDLAIRLADLINAEIISADSRLLYKGMDIGTAKPYKVQMKKVRHHLIDLAEPEDTWSLSKYDNAVKQAIMDIHSRGKLPLLVGGTGQYIRSLIEGWTIPEVPPDPKLRAVVEAWGQKIGAIELFKKLQILDPLASGKNDPENLRRTVRALEVIFITGKRFSSQRVKTDPIYDYKIIGLTRPRSELYKRVDDRIEAMFDCGFIDEVEGLLSRGIPIATPALTAIGYSEVIGYLRGELSLEEAKASMQKKTRNFIRKQANWFKPDDPFIEWFDMESDPTESISISISHWLEEGKLSE